MRDDTNVQGPLRRRMTTPESVSIIIREFRAEMSTYSSRSCGVGTRHVDKRFRNNFPGAELILTADSINRRDELRTLGGEIPRVAARVYLQAIRRPVLICLRISTA
jgi:hypothetical protein